jgi:hypothetical protein
MFLEFGAVAHPFSLLVPGSVLLARRRFASCSRPASRVPRPEQSHSLSYWIFLPSDFAWIDFDDLLHFI